MNRRKMILLSFLSSIPLFSKSSFSLPSDISPTSVQKDTDFATVYHCDFPQEARFNQMMNYITNQLNYFNADPTKIKIIVVCIGPGVKFLMKTLLNSPWEKEEIDTKKHISKAKDLTTYGVEFWICNNTIKNFNLKKEDFPDFCKVVPAGIVAITELQSKGFAYIKAQ
ncbi:DsrE family protein [Sulfurihydrogenibium subterraneum]|uniref:DsrE family protein n=1 Tax=Sulfurihydrogenibium subterraneum TaxID=171121 RepID=UPI000491A8A2|nr:DsrE family protein [Sulfurihydrogenibium subterraneum]